MRILIAALTAACLAGPAHAASNRYFVEGILGGGAGNITVDENGTDPELSFNEAFVDLTFNLGSVNVAGIPYSEAQFLNHSSFVNFIQVKKTAEEAEDQSNQIFSGRYVLRSGLFFKAIGDIDTDNSDNSIYEVQLGKYTSDYTSVFGGYVVDDILDANIFTFGLEHTSPYQGGSRWIGYDLGGRYLIEGADNEFAVNVGATYYHTFRSSLGIFYEFTDGRLTESHETNLFAEYYFSPRFAIRADAKAFRFGNVDENSAGASLQVRF